MAVCDDVSHGGVVIATMPLFIYCTLLCCFSRVSHIWIDVLCLFFPQLQAQVDAQGGGLVLSGWFAAIAVVALLALLAGVGYGIYYFYINPRRNYTLVVKNAPGTT